MLARRLDLPRYEAIAINTLANVMYELGERADALHCAREAVDLARRIGDEQQVINALGNLGTHLRGAHELTQAQETLEEALQRARVTGRRSPLAAVLLNVAMITLDRGEAAATLATLDELLPLVDSLRSPTLTACLLDVVAATQESGGDSRSAVALWDRADTLYAACGATREGPDADFVVRWRSPAARNDTGTLSTEGLSNSGPNEPLESALALIRSSLRALQARSTDPGSRTPPHA